MNVLRRFFESERGPALWKWAAFQTLLIWAIGAILWLIGGKVTVATFAGAGMMLGIVGAFVLFVTPITQTFLVVALVGIIDFFSFSVPLGSIFSPLLGASGGVMLIGALAALLFIFRKLEYDWDVPMWQDEVDETGLEPELRALIQGRTKQ